MYKLNSEKLKYVFIIFLFYTNISILLSNEINSNINIKEKIATVDTNQTYMSYMVDVLPQFPGGSDSLQDFINNNLKLNKLQCEYEGIVSVCFTINRDGSTNSRNIYVEPSPDIFNELFIKLLSKMPKWKPGHKKGIIVNTMICLPFKIHVR